VVGIDYDLEREITVRCGASDAGREIRKALREVDGLMFDRETRYLPDPWRRILIFFATLVKISSARSSISRV
jgi:hypothetical protein